VLVPIYEYRCNDCGHQFEVSQRMTDDPLTECPVCQGRVQKVLFAPAIHFKGTGFHNTDYGTRKRPVGGDGGDSGSSDGAKGGDGAKPGGEGGAAKKEPAASSSGSKKTVGLDKV
jgi:putative FmdB family regulatory protein